MKPKLGSVWHSEVNNVDFVVVGEEEYQSCWGFPCYFDAFCFIRFGDDKRVFGLTDTAEIFYRTCRLVRQPSDDPWSKGPEGETLGPSGLRWL